MSDLVERLRSEQQRLTTYGYRVSGIIGDAADLIEQRELEELRSEVAINNRSVKANAKMCRLAQEECDEWKHKKFARFNDEECWLFADDGDDNLHSLICPVVMSKDKSIELVEARSKLESLIVGIDALIGNAIRSEDNGALKGLIKLREQSPQTSLAEVRAQQAEESYKKGSADMATAIDDGSVSLKEISLLSFWSATQAKQHANKIRNGD